MTRDRRGSRSILVLAALLGGCGRADVAAPSASASCPAPTLVIHRECCSDCLEGEPGLDWAEQWRRGFGFSCEGGGLGKAPRCQDSCRLRLMTPGA